MSKPKSLPKIDPETLNKIFEDAKENNDAAILLQCTQIVLMSELKTSIKELSSKLQEYSKSISDIFADYEVGVEIYPKEEKDSED